MGENITDGKKLEDLLAALDITAHNLAVKLGYKSHASVYHVINGINSLSEGMIERIVKAVPNASYQFLKFGKLPVLLGNEGIQAQMNLFNLPPTPNSELFKLKRIMDVPDQLDRIEEMLIDLLNRQN
jgi:hypothetical protein